MSSINNLKNRLEGKTVLSVEPSYKGDSVCTFKLDDGTSFTLFANDMDWWITEEEKEEDRWKLLKRNIYNF